MREWLKAIMLLLAMLLPACVSAGEVTITPFPPDGQAQLIVADGWCYIVRGTTPVASWQISETPDPPDPPPLGHKTVVIVHESLNPTEAENRVIAQLVLRLTQNGQDYRLFDPQQTGAADKTPAWAKVVLDSGKKEPLLAVVNKSPTDVYSVIGVEPLPATIDAAETLIRKWGVK